MIPPLPHDILLSTLDHITDRVSLVQCCLTSKSLLPIARRALYVSIHFTFHDIGRDRSDIWRHWGSDTRSSHPLDRLDSESGLLLATIRRNHHLRSLVREITLEGMLEREAGVTADAETRPSAASLLRELVESVPSVDLIILDQLTSTEAIDQYLGMLERKSRTDSEGGGGVLPKFRMVLTGDTIERLDHLQGSYEGIRAVENSWQTRPTFLANRFLKASEPTLRRLELPVLPSTTLSPFTSLEYLTVYLLKDTPSAVLDSIVRELRNLPSLRSFILTGTILPGDIADLLGRGVLIASLPPSLIRLSIEGPIPTTHLLSVLLDLPASSKLEKFNCLRGTVTRLGGSRGRDGAEEQKEGEAHLVEEFRERRIRLTYDEYWW